MRLDRSTWPQVEDYLKRCDGILLPTGSNEQHGPIGLIGTDAICAESICERAGDIADALVAPTLAYTPAPFNMAFPGTISITTETFSTVVHEIFQGLVQQGFRHIYVLNGHGANLEPLRTAAADMIDDAVRIRSWWDFKDVNTLRASLYGDWEGMHATPSEIAIVEALYGTANHAELDPPQHLTQDFIKAHAGDRHGPADEHRAQFPDGRVGSHSSLARPEHGAELLRLASEAVAADFEEFAMKSG